MEAIPSVNAIIEGFPQKPVKIRGLPNYHTLNSPRQCLYRNANLFTSTLGGGNHGYLGALMPTPTYLAATQPNATAFVAPIFPGYLPVVQGTQAQISDQVQAHNENLRKWKEHKNVTKTIRKQLIDSVDPAYLAHLEDPYSGFNKVPVKDILLDLFDNYGKIRSTDLVANNKQFEEDWDPTETFQTVMARVKQCCEFANDAGQPYSDEQILAKTHAMVFNTGLYHNALEKWDEVPIGQANYENFCKHMIQVQKRLQNKKTTKQQGYGVAANQIQELIEFFCNIVTSKRQDKENDRAIINLMRQEMADMHLLIEQLQNKPLPAPRNCSHKPSVGQQSYCWTHGYAVTKSHNSQNCRTKGLGHKDDAS
jgi:hypothetical protein